MTIVAGVCAGLVGALVTLFIHALEHVTGFNHLAAVAIPALAGIFAGFCWWRLRSYGAPPSVNTALASNEKSYTRLPILTSLIDGALQILVVGAGASLGREQAPRQIAAAVTDQMLAGVRIPAALQQVSPETRIEIRGKLIAAAAGAGLAAVYNVPIAGVIYTLELLPVKRDRYTLIIAATMSIIATLVARPVVGGEAFYQFPTPHFTAPALMALAAVAALAPLVGVIFRRVIMIRPRFAHKLLPLTVGAALAIMGVVSLWQPTLLGNGEMMLHIAFTDSTLQVFWLMVALLAAKILLTWMCLASGAVGGVLTPSLAVGAACGAVVSLGFSSLGVDNSLPLMALVGAAAVLAIMQRAPLFALVFAVELTHPPVWVYVPVALIAISSYYLTRRIR